MQVLRRSTKPVRNTRSRSGAALVETAIVLPVLLTLVVGSMEVTDAIFLKHSLKSATYEAARKISLSGSTQAQATTVANSVLTAYGVKGYTVSFSPTVTLATTQGTVITVTASAPMSSNRLFLSNVSGFSSRTFSASTTMTRQ
ncbi:MAG: TadE/TadG family type IV pilus assembly protein [Planctomycetales bacterium]